MAFNVDGNSLNILVTGGSGFLGSALAKALQGEGHRVDILVRSSSKLTRLKGAEHLLNIRRYQNQAELSALIREIEPNLVIHTACSYGRANETDLEIFEANFLLGVKILQSLVDSDMPISFINIGTVLPPSLSLYALCKHGFSQWGRAIALGRATNLRFLNVLLQHVYGPGDDPSKFTSHVIGACHTQEAVLRLTEGLQRRDLVYVEDVVSAFLALVRCHDKQGAYSEIEVGSGVAITVRDFAETVRRLTQSKTVLLFGDLPYRENEPMLCVADLSKMAELGWSPAFDLESGLKETIRMEFLQ